VTRFDPARASLLARAFSYPYGPPLVPVVFSGGSFRPAARLRAVVDPAGLVDVAGLGVCAPVLAIGSNAALAVLRRKFGTGRAALVQGPAQLAGYAGVHSAHISRYGAMPATLIEASGVLRGHLQLVPVNQLARLDASEALGVNYERVRLPGSGLRAPWLGLRLPFVWVYRSHHGAALREGVPISLGPQRKALAHAAEQAGWTLDLEAFVYLLVRDPSFRFAVTEALKG